MADPISPVPSILVYGVLIAAVIYGLMIRPLRRQRRAVLDRLRAGGPMGDRAFEAAIGVGPGDARLAREVRRAAASQLGRPRQQYRPEHRTRDLQIITWDGWDELDAIFRLERRLGMKIPRRLPDGSVYPAFLASETFGEWSASVVAYLRRIEAGRS